MIASFQKFSGFGKRARLIKREPELCRIQTPDTVVGKKLYLFLYPLEISGFVKKSKFLPRLKAAMFARDSVCF